MNYISIPKIISLSLVIYLYVFISTEILSSFQLLERSFIVLFDVLFLFIVYLMNKKILTKSISNFDWHSRSSVIISTILLLTFAQGFFSAPSTTDSMVYHVPRLMYWIQEKTLAQDVIRNPHDFMPPFAEYMLLHLYLIAGNDRLLFLSQWLAYVFLIYLSGIIFLQLGGDKKNQSAVRLLIATLPMAILQSVSTQTDLVTSVFVLISIYLSLNLAKSFSLNNFFWLGVSIGLGLLTKPTFLIYFLIPLGIIGFQLLRNLKKSFLIMVTLLVALIIQLRYFLQNIFLYGSLLGKHVENGTEVVYINQIFSPGLIILNLVRNILLQLPFPFLVSPAQEVLKGLGIIFGININDPGITWGNPLLAIKGVIYPQEDIVSSPLHIFLIMILLVALIHLRMIIGSQVKIMIFSLGFSFLFFSALLVWQPYHPRLHLLFLLVGTILSVIIFSKLKNGNKILNLMVILSVVLGFILILFNVSRPYISYNLFHKYLQSFTSPLTSVPKSFFLKPRIEQYFNARYYWYIPYKDIVNELANQKLSSVNTITFDLSDGFEYPLWVLLKQKGISTKVIAKNDSRMPQYLIKSSISEETVAGFDLIKCEKTIVDYGYLCLYNHQN